MTMYGLYVRDPATDDFVWFTTDKSLEPGAYILGRHHATSHNVYVAESIAALVLQVGSVIQQAEDRAQSSLIPTGTPPDVERRNGPRPAPAETHIVQYAATLISVQIEDAQTLAAAYDKSHGASCRRVLNAGDFDCTRRQKTLAPGGKRPCEVPRQ